jgi:hypothetical protein
MIQCANCHHQEIAGSLFCSECGSQLIFIGNSETLITRNNSTENDHEGLNSTNKLIIETNNGENRITFFSLNILEYDKKLDLPDNTECTLGRITEGQPILPDIDLSEFDAHERGVSRLHAVLKVINHKLFVNDLESSNGTRVNGQKIVPYTDIQLNHGDILSLGKLKIQVLFH